MKAVPNYPASFSYGGRVRTIMDMLAGTLLGIGIATIPIGLGEKDVYKIFLGICFALTGIYLMWRRVNEEG